MNTIKTLIPIFAFLIFCACSSSTVVDIIVTNELDIARTNETIEVDLNSTQNLLEKYLPEQLVVKESESDDILLSQLIDLDGDGIQDLLIFQSDFKPKESKHFRLDGSDIKIEMPTSDRSTYARFVPERIDDFAWENDRVAFRTYGPEAQAITESGEPGGTLSSGIDCWLKRVEYPIIDKWYKQDLQEGKSYHQDHGEGLDSYHVGASRGTGGIGIWKDSSLFTSKNYESWKIITNGPIRTIFELDYGTWEANGLSVQEIKRISIDLGSNLFKSTLILGNHEELPNVTLGVTLHEKTGEVASDIEKGWFRYWEPHEDSELSTAIVVDPSIIKQFIDYRVDEPDLSNLLVVCEPSKEVTYYAGFAWGKSNQFELPTGFDLYLNEFSKRIASPLKVEVVE